MVSSLIGPQYHDDQFWTFSEAAAEHQTNEFDVAMVPTFREDFEVKRSDKKQPTFIVLESGLTATNCLLTFLVRPFPRDRRWNDQIRRTESRTRIPGWR